MKLFRALIVTALVILSASAEAQSLSRIQAPWAIDNSALQYMQSCGAGKWSVRAVTGAAAGRSKAFKQENRWLQTDPNQIFVFGEQIVAQGSTAGMICEGMVPTSTVTTNAGTCNENCGYTTYDSTRTRAGVQNCHIMAMANVPYFFKISSMGWTWMPNSPSQMNVAARPFRCLSAGADAGTGEAGVDQAATGGGCGTNNDCGSGGVCSLNSNSPAYAVYLFWIPFTAGGVGRVETCVQ